MRACVRVCVCVMETTEEKQNLSMLEAGMSVVVFLLLFFLVLNMNTYFTKCLRTIFPGSQSARVSAIPGF